VTDLDGHSVSARRPDGETERILTRTIVWSAGVVASELASALADASGAELDRGGRIAVGPELSIQGHRDVIALGDMVNVHDAAGNDLGLPGLASTAMQQERYAAAAVRARLRGRTPRPLPLRRQGQSRHDWARQRGRGDQGHPDQRNACLADLARRPHLLPVRPPESPARSHPLGVQLPDPRTRREADRLQSGLAAGLDGGALS
jgi:Pyridine nucleotide-disulphide oxidoreductase